MNAARHVDAVSVVRDPPLVVVAPALQRRIVAEHERLAAAALANLLYDGFRHDLLAVEAAVEAHHLAEAREVAQPRVQRGADERRAVGVDLQERILLDTEPGPDALAQHFGRRLLRHARNEPTQHIAVRRAVMEFRAVRSLLLDRRQKRADAAARARGIPARRVAV